MITYTHKRKDYRITAVPLTQEITLADGSHGRVGDYFVTDEEGQNLIFTAERIERDYVAFSKVKVDITDPMIQRIIGSSNSFSASLDPEKYRVSD